MLVFLSVFAIILVLYLGVCAFYYVAQEKFIFVRFPTKRKYKYKIKLTHEELFIPISDGGVLHALYFPVENSKGLVLYYHGNTGSLKRWAKQARYFVSNGFSVLMPDPRGYGKSKGKLSERALIDDALLWYDQAKQLEVEERLIVYGRSLGSAMAVPVAAKGSPRSMVLETPFADLYDVARHYSALLPYRILLRYPFENCKRIKEVTCPIYIIHGTKDLIVPYSSALRLYSCIPPGVYREMITIPKGRHNDLSKFELFHEKMAEILQ